VTDLSPGVYRYHPKTHELERVLGGDIRKTLAAAAYGQQWFSGAPACVVFSAVYRRVTAKYGERGTRYADMEAGHAAQNFALQAAALDLGTVAVGAFEDDRVRELMTMAGEETPLYILPVGYPNAEG
jgi:SagB-type dehydrogenase family enzyme